jgi:hypothetical protein
MKVVCDNGMPVVTVGYVKETMNEMKHERGEGGKQKSDRGRERDRRREGR